jgi:pyridoxal phosphate-dependent aminotransferase EpsN
MISRIPLSPPHLGEDELALVTEAFRASHVALAGPDVDEFEQEFAAYVDSPHAVAVSSGTAALHLALLALSIGVGDMVWVSTFTFAASVFPITYVGATPVFVDSVRNTWGMDPHLLAEALDDAAMRETLPRAVVVVHAYGQCADLEPIMEACARHGVLLIEDAAEALGAQYKGRAAGTFGDVGFYSFNGNKIITTSGGGMLVTRHDDVAKRARYLATQASEPLPHAEHTHIGYNYRMGNVQAAIGRGQLRVIEQRVAARRAVFGRYADALGETPGLSFMPEERFAALDSRATRWLTVISLDRREFGADPETVRIVLERANIESRPVWKPMHRQPVFRRGDAIGGSVADDLYAHGLCLPSGSSLSVSEQDRVIAAVQSACHSLPPAPRRSTPSVPAAR